MATDLEILQETLAALYRFEHMLGRGGMATVYRAHDLRHDRPVAFKVLRRELSEALGLDRRFGREIAIAAQLAHPNILGVIDSGTIDGPSGKLHYYVMPFVAGESLRERLEGNQQLPLDEALAFTEEAADALAHAHAQHVIHRDIKPGNILIQAGHALVADFGIAQMALGATDETVTTSAGMVLGTPTYMSPEQAEGGEVDGRSDVYSLGCVFYEMLAGEPPFSGATAQALAARHRLDPPPSLRTSRPDLPPDVDQIIHKALAKRPADRWKSAAAFRDALLRLPSDLAASTGRREAARAHRQGRWVLAAAVVLAAAAVGLFLLRPGRLTGDTRPMVVVDAFADETGGTLRAEATALRDGLLQALQAAPNLDVRLGPADSSPDARWAVVGSIDRLGDSVVARARVVDLADRAELHVAREAAPDGVRLVAGAQAPSRGSLFSAIRFTLATAMHQDRRRSQVQDSAAWALAERGAALIRGVDAPALIQAGPEWAVRQIQRGDSLIAEALRREPDSPALLAMKLDAVEGAALAAEQAAQIFTDSARIGDPIALRQGAVPTARRAVERFPESADLQVNLGRLLGNLYRANHDHDLLEQGIASFTRATALDPTHTDAWLELARLQIEAGLYGQALTSARTGLGTDPFLLHDEDLRRAQFESLLRLEQEVPAERACTESQRLYPGGFYFIDCRAEVAQRFSEDPADARQAVALADSLDRAHSAIAPQLGGKLRLIAATVYARAGQRRLGDSLWHEVTREWTPGRSLPTYLLLDGVYARVVRGETDEALRLLARAVREDPTVPDIVEDEPWFRSLRADPRYLLALRGTDPLEATAP